MRFRRRAFGRSRGKRSTSWVNGLNTFTIGGGEPRWRIITCTPVVPGSLTFGGAIIQVGVGDLPEHGGEDAVVCRIRGSLAFFRGRRDSGAGFAANSFQLRVLVVQTDGTRAGTIMPFDYCTSEGLGRDDILYCETAIVPSTDPGVTGTGFDAIDFSNGARRLEIDIKAKRKVQVDRPIVVWFQTATPAGTVGLDFGVVGALRTLMMRPR